MGYTSQNVIVDVGVRDDSGWTRVGIFTGDITEHAIAMLCQQLWGQVSEEHKKQIIAGEEIDGQDKEHSCYKWRTAEAQKMSDPFEIPAEPVCDLCASPAKFTTITPHKRLFRCRPCTGALWGQWNEMQ